MVSLLIDENCCWQYCHLHVATGLPLCSCRIDSSVVCSSKFWLCFDWLPYIHIPHYNNKTLRFIFTATIKIFFVWSSQEIKKLDQTEDINVKPKSFKIPVKIIPVRLLVQNLKKILLVPWFEQQWVRFYAPNNEIDFQYISLSNSNSQCIKIDFIFC